MNTSAIAQNLASRGRGEDKMLVHMTPSEVDGLQALAMAQGGSLTINPETGLLEAGVLSNTFKALAPTLIGAGLAYFGGMPAWAAGLTVGGVEAVRKDDLGAGLMAGLGAYGGAGMANSFTSMGTPKAGVGLSTEANKYGLTTNFAPPETFTEPITNSALQQGPVGGMDFGPNVNNFGNVPPPTVVQPLTPANYAPYTPADYGLDSLSSGPGFKAPSTLETNPMSPNLVSGQKGTLVPIAEGGVTDSYFYRPDPVPNPTFEGVKQTFEPGGFGKFKDAYVNEMGGGKKALLGLAGVGASVADGYGAFDPKPFDIAKAETDDYGGPYEPTPRTARFQSTDDILAGGGREFKYFDNVNPYPNVRPIQAAEGGLMALDAADEGRFLEGAGDGVSDSIPAMVDGEQPVMLSDGEYIMPAEFVSAIGNGSSDAGAAKLTSLVDRVMANTRKAKKGKPNGADNMLKGLVAPA